MFPERTEALKMSDWDLGVWEKKSWCSQLTLGCRCLSFYARDRTVNLISL